MTFKDACMEYEKDKTKETLYSVAKKVKDELTLKEKLHMLSGNNKETFISTLKHSIKDKRPYNFKPWVAGGVERLGIPKIAFTDGPRGVVMGYSTCFPVAMMRAASFDLDLEKEVATVFAKEAIAQGANYFAGICINLLRNPRWGRAQESYGEDPFVLGEFGATVTKVMQDNGIISCPKHYAVNSLENLRFEVNVHADKRTMYEVYLPHFKKCIDAGAASIMGAYNKYEDDYCCENKWLLKDVLRDEWGFDGFTLSDFLWGVHNGPKALKAGLDIEMPFTLKYAWLKRALRNNEITIEDIDNSVESILRGMIRTLPNKRHYSKNVIQCQKHLDLARKAAEEGTVLLKNDGILPIAKDKRIAVIGRYANKENLGDHGSSAVFSDVVVTAFEGIKEVYGFGKVAGTSGKSLEKACYLADKADAVVIIAGLDYTDEGEYLINKKSNKIKFKGQGGDRKNMRISDEDVALIKKISEVNPNVVVSLSGGSALIINEWEDCAKGILMSFYSGSMGGSALANILCGNVNPSGKLPFTVASREEDYPPIITDMDVERDIVYNYYHGYSLFDKTKAPVSYPFGFGLSYTSFSFSRLSVSEDGDDILVKISVKNTGDVEGTEVVQVYFGSTDNSKERPKKLLKGFKRVTLEPKKSKTVTISVSKKELKFYNEEAKNWELDNEYNVFVGNSSKDAESRNTTILLSDS